MTERTREREATEVSYNDDDERYDRIRYDEPDIDMADLLPAAAAATSSTSAVNASSLRDGLAKADEFQVPLWLIRKLPVMWLESDITCQKSVSRPGKNCCLFFPLSYCPKDTDIMNGLCPFHWRAIFNLTLHNGALYQLNAKGQAVVWFRSQCYVADPRPIDDRMTACFPLLELFDREPTINEINLSNLERYLVSIRAPNWEKIYSLHVNFLHRLITVHSNFAQPQRPSRKDHLFDNQLIMHWNMWNEYYSWVLKKSPAQLYLFHISDKSDEVKAIPIEKCTTLTQMIVRMFSECYTRLDDNRFLTGPSSYGVWIRGHLAYSDNLCSHGTTFMANNVPTVGALATLPLLRTDAYRKSTIWYEKGVNCRESLCVNSKVDHTGLNRSVIASSSSSSSSSSSGDKE